MSQNDVSIEERTKVYEICKTQLGGKWAEVNQNDLVIKPVPDGFVNKLFFCFLPENIKTQHNKVVVRYVDFEELKEFVSSTHIIAISLILSEKRISPRILRIFNQGTIIEYIPCRYFDANDDLNHKNVEQLAEKLSNFHSLNIPIPKNSAEESMVSIFVTWFNGDVRDSYKEGVVRELIEKHKYEVLSKLDYIEESFWLRKTIEELNSPIVLSHNDLNRRNILMREEDGFKELEIFLIDFDWTNYNYRGLDLGQYFACWRQKETDFGYINFPSNQEMSVFIDAYIEGMTKIFGSSYAKQKINSRERLIREAKLFALFSFLKDILYCFWTATKSENKGIMTKAEERFRCYDELKSRYLEEYITL